jgi:hypothetical protein
MNEFMDCFLDECIKLKNGINNAKKTNNIIDSMREFQKINNIKSQCITNTQYFYDTLKNNTSVNAKAKAVFAVSNDEETDTWLVINHMVITIDETVLEPSYEVYSLKNVKYYDSINHFLSLFQNPNEQITNLKEYLTKFIKFVKMAERINNDEFIITDKEFYNKQADYIENLYS